LSFGFLASRSARRIKDITEPERSQENSFFCLGNYFQNLASLEIISSLQYKTEGGKRRNSLRKGFGSDSFWKEYEVERSQPTGTAAVDFL
jgi:hypothetical protein